MLFFRHPSSFFVFLFQMPFLCVRGFANAEQLHEFLARSVAVRSALLVVGQGATLAECNASVRQFPLHRLVSGSSTMAGEGFSCMR